MKSKYKKIKSYLDLYTYIKKNYIYLTYEYLMMLRHCILSYSFNKLQYICLSLGLLKCPTNARLLFYQQLNYELLCQVQIQRVFISDFDWEKSYIVSSYNLVTQWSALGNHKNNVLLNQNRGNLFTISFIMIWRTYTDMR